jgi:hypothetical protein
MYFMFLISDPCRHLVTHEAVVYVRWGTHTSFSYIDLHCSCPALHLLAKKKNRYITRTFDILEYTAL